MGKLTSPSDALDIDPWEFPPEEWHATLSCEGSNINTGALAETSGTIPVASVRKRRRGAKASNSNAAGKAGTPKSGQIAPHASLSPTLLPTAALPPPLVELQGFKPYFAISRL